MDTRIPPNHTAENTHISQLKVLLYTAKTIKKKNQTYNLKLKLNKKLKLKPARFTPSLQWK